MKVASGMVREAKKGLAKKPIWNRSNGKRSKVFKGQATLLFGNEENLVGEDASLNNIKRELTQDPDSFRGEKLAVLNMGPIETRRA